LPKRIFQRSYPFTAPLQVFPHPPSLSFCWSFFPIAFFFTESLGPTLPFFVHFRKTDLDPGGWLVAIPTCTPSFSFPKLKAPHVFANFVSLHPILGEWFAIGAAFLPDIFHPHLFLCSPYCALFFWVSCHEWFLGLPFFLFCQSFPPLVAQRSIRHLSPLFLFPASFFFLLFSFSSPPPSPAPSEHPSGLPPTFLLQVSPSLRLRGNHWQLSTHA